MAVLDLAALNDSFINVYQPGITEQAARLVSDPVKVVEAKSEPGEGVDIPRLEARFGLEFVPSHITGFIGEGENFPEGEAPIRAEALYKLCEHTYRIKISDRAIRRGSTGDGQNGAFDDVLNREVNNVSEQIARWKSIMAWHEGFGVLARCKATTASTTLNLADSTTKAQMRNFKRNDPIEIGTVDDPTEASTRVKIVSVNAAAKTLTLSAAVTTTTSHRVFEAGSGGSDDWGPRAPVSFHQIIGTGELHGVDPATHPEWQSLIDTAGSGRVLDETLFEKVLDDIGMLAGDVNPTDTILVASNGVVRRTKADQGPLVQYTMIEQENLKVGIKAIELCGHALLKDSYHPEEEATVIDTSARGVKFLSPGDGYVSLDNGPGAPAGFALDTETREYQNRGAAYWNWGAKSRNGSARIKNLLEA